MSSSLTPFRHRRRAMLDIVDSVNAKGTVRIRPESVFT